MTAHGKISPVVIVLLSGILVALTVLILFVTRSGGRGDSTDGSVRPEVAPIAAGQTETRGQAVLRGMRLSAPSKALDTGRIAATYIPGRTYRTVVKVSLTSRGSKKDWGVVADMNMHYAGEMETLRTVEANDGRTMTLLLEFRRAENLAIYTAVEGIRFDLGGRGTLAVAAVDWAGTGFGLPTGWTAITMATTERIANFPPVRQALGEVANDATAKVFAYVSSLQGKKIRVKYVNGEGVTEITPINAALSGNEKGLIYGTAVASDAYILPDLACKSGDTWTIQGLDMLPVIDSSLHATMQGEIAVSRKADLGTPDGPVALIQIDRGTLDLRDSDDVSSSVGRWTPRGRIEFSFKDKIVTGADLTGALYCEKRSTDHIIFESRLTLQPQYKITYFCEIVKSP